MSASTSGVLVEEYVLEVVRKANAEEFLKKIVFGLQVRRFEHFSQIQEKDMIRIGMPPEKIKPLKEQIVRMHRDLWNKSPPKQIYVGNDDSTLNTIDERALIPKEEIAVYEKLGEGSFAVVKRGVWTQPDGSKHTVAVKILRGITANVMEDLRIEASHLLKLNHPSLIRLYGIVQQPAMMVFELCEGGSLLDRLRDDKKPILLISQLLDYSVQIAKALQFLESKHCVHRDVAARNILLSKNEHSVKICDFGLMRALKDNEQMYTMAPQKKVPFAWCPPEALRHRKFSHASDVWSYGVTLWEIFTFGEEPWIGCRAVDVLKNIDAGERLEKPKYCSQKLYDIMQKCWTTDPERRIKFSAIREDLKAATFLNAIVREAFHSIQPGSLKLDVSDEVIVIENNHQEWYGQNKKNLFFGMFPRSCVFVPSNNVANVVAAVTPQKTPYVSTVKLPPAARQVTLRDINKSEPSTSKESRISMPIQGSLIHTGHGDPFGQQSWGSPSIIDDVYLKNPVRGNPLSRLTNGAEIRDTKSEITTSNGIGNMPASSGGSTTATSRISLQMPDLGDEFEKAFNDSFSPSEIEYPRDFAVGFHNSSGISLQQRDEWSVLTPTPIAPPKHQQPPKQNQQQQQAQIALVPNRVTQVQQPRHVSSAGSRLDSMGTNGSSNSQHNDFGLVNNGSSNYKRELEMMISRPRPASSIGMLNSSDLRSFDPMFSQSTVRPTSVVQTTTIPVIRSTAQSSQLPCLIPTQLQPTPPSHNVFSNLALQNPNQKSITDELKKNLKKPPTTNVAAPISVPRRESPPMTVAPSPPQFSAPTLPSQPQHTLSKPPVKNINNNSIIKPQEGPRRTSPENSASAAVVQKRSLPARSTTTLPSEEERKSRILDEVRSVLPAPSSLLFGSSNESATVRLPPKTSDVNRSQPQQSSQQPPVKKHSEPILSMSTVLQPTRLPTAEVKTIPNTTRPTVPAAEDSRRAVTKPSVVPQQQTTLPLFNITNSAMSFHPTQVYPSIYGGGSMPGTSSGYLPNYIPYQSSIIPTYNPLLSNPLPPLHQSENRSTTVARPLDESHIQEFLGSTGQSTSTPSVSSTSRTAPNNGALTMAEKMEILYREAQFTQRGNCDLMVNQCSGDVELALKKLKQQHLVELGVAQTLEKARNALETKNYDLSAAADFLLG